MSVHEDLVLLALGRLPPREREALTLRLKQDPALAREADAVARHLARYDHLPPAPEPPPFAALAPRLGTQPAARRRWSSWAWAAVALLAVAPWAVRLVRDARERAAVEALDAHLVGSFFRGGETRLAPGNTLECDSRSALRIGERVHIVLDAGARLTLDTRERVRLGAGRAWFDVDRSPLRVDTPHGPVDVVGTAFEIALEPGLRVEVEEGVVRAAGREVRAGTGLRDGAPYALAGRPGAFARRPALVVERPALAPDGRVLEITLAFVNTVGVRQELAGPETAAMGAWLAFEGPGGATHGQGVDVLAAAGGRVPAAGRLPLAPGERLEIPVTVPLPPGPAGSWRLTALYRPEGEAPISSAPVTFEIPPR